MNRNYRIRLLLVVFLLLLLASCSRLKAEAGKGLPAGGVGEKSFDSRHYATTSVYSVAPGTLTNQDKPRPEGNEDWLSALELNYPQLYNLEDSAKEKRINDTLFEEALNIREALADRTYIEYKMDYDIMEAADRVLSVLFTGGMHSPGRNQPIAYAVTYDLEKEQFLELSDFFHIEDTFVAAHLHKDFKVVDNPFDSLSEIDDRVEAYIEEYKLKEHRHDFYVRNGTLGLIIPAPEAIGYLILEGNMGGK